MTYPVAIGEEESKSTKAGRFVRAAGLGLGAAARELNKSVQETRAEEAAVLAATPPPQPPAPERTGGAVGRLAFYGFVGAVVSLALVALHAQGLIGSGSPRHVFELVVVVLLVVEAFLLTSNWHGANRRLSQRVLTRVWGPRGAVTRRERVFARVLRDVLTLVGIVFLAAAVFEILRSTVSSP
jgi:hypothetical protein